MENPPEKNRSQYDTTFKDLFGQPPQRLIQLLVGQQAVQLLAVEFASTQKRHPDLLFLLQDETIFHLELQGSPEEMKWRLLMYYALIRQRYPDKALVQKVLYVGYEPWRPQTTLAEDKLQFSYEVVDIRTIDCRLLMESPVLEENILAILCRMENQQETIQEILYRISQLPPKARADALTKLLILSRLRKLEAVVQMEAQEMSLTFNVMENDVLRPLFMKAQQESEQRGERKGLLEGERKGRQEEASAILLRILNRRFGPLPSWATAQITAADLSTLEEWTDRSLDAQSLEEVCGESRNSLVETPTQ